MEVKVYNGHDNCRQIGKITWKAAVMEVSGCSRGTHDEVSNSPSHSFHTTDGRIVMFPLENSPDVVGCFGWLTFSCIALSLILFFFYLNLCGLWLV